MQTFAKVLAAWVAVGGGLGVVSAGAAEPRGKAVVLVAGATGGTGREVVERTLAAGHEVRVLVRDEAKARERFGDRVTYATGDVLKPATVSAAMANVDYVISAIGSNTRQDPANKPEFVDYGGVKTLVESARAAKVRQFVLVSSMGVTDPNHMLNRVFDDVLKWKLKGEDALRASGVPYTIVRPSGLQNGPGGTTGFRTTQGDPKGGTGLIARGHVAAICVAALGRDEALGKTFEVAGDKAAAPPEWNTFFAQLARDAAPAPVNE